MTEKGWQQGLYRNTPSCIVTRRRAEGRAISPPTPRHGQVRAQHTPTIRQPVRCDTAMEAYDTHNTASRGVGQGEQGRGARRALHGAQGRARVRCDTAAWPSTQPGSPTTTWRDTAPGRPCARLGVLVGSTGCAFGALSLF